jgi:hypothetical protein
MKWVHRQRWATAQNEPRTPPSRVNTRKWRPRARDPVRHKLRSHGESECLEQLNCRCEMWPLKRGEGGDQGVTNHVTFHSEDETSREKCISGQLNCLTVINQEFIFFLLHGLSPRANYTDRATADCRRSDCQLVRIEGVTWSA